MKQAFFAAGGGLAVPSVDFWYTTTITFTPRGLVELAKLDLIPDLTKEDVEDRSKADIFAKVATIVQVSWFFAQSLTRLASHLPLTLLEVHVTIHVFCAVIMYCLWFNKPYEVAYPVQSKDSRVIDIAAMFLVNDRTVRY